ncbi:unnamed protein product, partial [Effrenium voratum]
MVHQLDAALLCWSMVFGVQRYRHLQRSRVASADTSSPIGVVGSIGRWCLGTMLSGTDLFPAGDRSYSFRRICPIVPGGLDGSVHSMPHQQATPTMSSSPSLPVAGAEFDVAFSQKAERWQRAGHLSNPEPPVARLAAGIGSIWLRGLPGLRGCGISLLLLAMGKTACGGEDLPDRYRHVCMVAEQSWAAIVAYYHCQDWTFDKGSAQSFYCDLALQ